MDTTIFMQSPKLLRRATPSVKSLSMGGSFSRFRARKKVCCIAREPESIFKSGAWNNLSNVVFFYSSSFDFIGPLRF